MVVLYGTYIHMYVHCNLFEKPVFKQVLQVHGYRYPKDILSCLTRVGILREPCTPTCGHSISLIQTPDSAAHSNEAM